MVVKATISPLPRAPLTQRCRVLLALTGIALLVALALAAAVVNAAAERLY